MDDLFCIETHGDLGIPHDLRTPHKKKNGKVDPTVPASHMVSAKPAPSSTE